MGTNYKVRLRRFNGTDYDVLNLSSKNIIMENGSNVEDEINSIEENLDLINKIYPVGSIYMSVSSTINPSEFFVGTRWEKLESGRFLLSSGDNYGLGTKGGEEKHILTIGEMPSHTHGRKELSGRVWNLAYQSSTISVATTGICSPNDRIEAVGYATQLLGNKPDGFIIDASHEHEAIGDGKAHNNMPPYLVVHMWKRVS